MSEELDFNKAAAEFVNQNIEKLYNAGKDVLKGAADKMRLHLSNSYKEYLSCVAARYSRAKSFFIRNEPTYLYDFYVPLGVKSNKGTIDKPSIPLVTQVNQFVVLTGVAGTGKSMLMRHLFLDAIIQKNKVPIFIELRELNQSDQSLKDFIHHTLNANHFPLDNEYTEKAMKAGHFLFFLDGFDEVGLSRRKSITKEIQQLAGNYDRNSIVVSSRPEPEFGGWPAFSVLQIVPLTLDLACALIEKLPFDVDLKTKFLSDLRGGMFEKHESFLSNPLLLSIMLLTYELSADIPNKLNVFYNQAYEALFQRHDALKGAFQRDRSTNLDIQDFARVFAAFSVQTYDKRLFQLSHSQAVDFIEKSKKLVNLEFDSNSYLTDALRAVCLLIEDGLLINFSHRSFQEYFTALFLRDAKPDVQRMLIERYSRNLRSDSVLDLLYELKPDLVESVFIIPGVERLEKFLNLKKKVGMTHYLKFMKTEYDELTFHEDGEVWAHNGPNSKRFTSLISFALRHCGYLIGWTGFKNAGKTSPELRAVLPRNTGLGHTVVKASDLALRDPLSRQLAADDHFFSRRVLELAVSIKKALLEKQEGVDASLEEILGNGTR